MSISEFDIIEHYFMRSSLSPEVVVGVGDDAAVLKLPAGQQLVTSIDTMNEGVHFPPTTDAFDLGHKALAVSLSDMAAMGAKPATSLLALSLPVADGAWLQAFADGFFSLAEQHAVVLVGGDTCTGPLAVSTVVNGFVPAGQHLTRSSAEIGDAIYVTGTLGDAGLALSLLTAERDEIDSTLLSRFYRPTPRVEAGLALRGVANSVMDVSDGLAADLTKLCRASAVGAVIHADKLPLSSALMSQCGSREAWSYALCAGDDYELVFTLPLSLEAKLFSLDCSVTRIGEITTGEGVRILDSNRAEIRLEVLGYDHFR